MPGTLLPDSALCIYSFACIALFLRPLLQPLCTLYSYLCSLRIHIGSISKMDPSVGALPAPFQMDLHSLLACCLLHLLFPEPTHFLLSLTFYSRTIRSIACLSKYHTLNIKVQLKKMISKGSADAGRRFPSIRIASDAELNASTLKFQRGRVAVFSRAVGYFVTSRMDYE